MAFVSTDEIYVGSTDGTAGTGRDLFYDLITTFYEPSDGFAVPDSDLYGIDTLGTVSAFKSITGRTEQSDHRRYHYRMILVENPLALSNPPLNTNIAFNVWNTFPNPDELVGNTIDSDFVTTNLVTGVDIRDFEWLTVAIQILPGPSTIEASIVFDFTQGDATLIVRGELLLEAPTTPDSITETFKWVTTIIESYDGYEQRVRLAPAARKEISAKYPVDEEEYRSFAKVLRKGLLTNMKLPHFQYMTPLTQRSETDTTILYFNPNYTQLSVGDAIYIRDIPGGGVPITGIVQSFNSDGCVITPPLSRAVEKGFIVCPLREIFLNSPSQSMQSVTGDLTVKGEEVGRSRPLLRSGADPTLPSFNGRPVVNARVLSGMDETYPFEVEEYTTSFGSQSRVSAWETPRIQRKVAFRIKMSKNDGDFDWWMKFLDTVAGSHKSFYLPTFQADFQLQENPGVGETSIRVLGDLYTSTYLGDNVFSQIRILQRNGTALYYKIITAENLGAFDEFGLDAALPSDIVSNPPVQISFAHHVRIDGDQVSLDHSNNRTYVRFSVIGVPE